MSQTKLRWGILGTGTIAHAFAEGLRQTQSGTLVAIGSRTRESAEKFGEEFALDRRHGSYDALLADEQVDALYIATPHPMHAEWAVKAAEAGKHLLVEKPIAVNHAQAMAIVEAAAEHDVFLMEAFMYRCAPQTAKLIELIREGVIGDVRVINATFSFHWPVPYNMTSRLTSNELAGGGILDVGCYCASFARLVAGVARGHNAPAEPIDLYAVGHLGESGTDDYTVAVARFPGDIVAQLSCGVQVAQESVARIYGSEGHIHLPTPWVPARNGGVSSIFIHRRGEKQPREVRVEAKQQIYGIEADIVAASIKSRQGTFPAMSWNDSLGNMRMLDRWRSAIGLVYQSESVDAPMPTITRRPLRRRPNHAMKYGRIGGIDKPISRLVMGCDNQQAMPHAAVMFDHFFERGGNTFDTAYIYSRGMQEKLLGRWIRNRGVRDDVVIIGKGAHTPFCNPEDLTKQLHESLERLQVDHVDMYLLHRDNPEIPVGEFVDVLNEHQQSGRIKVFGGSNWSIPRLQAANDYAAAKGLRGFGVVSNQFSLSRMICVPWEGCLTATDAESRAWFEKTQTPLLAWSSQGRGFFIPGAAAPDKTDNAELVRLWYAEDNFRRLERVNDLATRRGVLPINIALAYVLHQPFPTFPLIGPRTLAELRSSLAALDIELTGQEARWLNLED
jgi:predicted dehydrogenase/aryl-alcohol dehydrogenase-like predicted oxidoreductase